MPGGWTVGQKFVGRGHLGSRMTSRRRVLLRFSVWLVCFWGVWMSRGWVKWVKGMMIRLENYGDITIKMVVIVRKSRIQNPLHSGLAQMIKNIETWRHMLIFADWYMLIYICLQKNTNHISYFLFFGGGLFWNRWFFEVFGEDTRLDRHQILEKMKFGSCHNDSIGRPGFGLGRFFKASGQISYLTNRPIGPQKGSVLEEKWDPGYFREIYPPWN